MKDFKTQWHSCRIGSAMVDGEGVLSAVLDYHLEKGALHNCIFTTLNNYTRTKHVQRVFQGLAPPPRMTASEEPQQPKPLRLFLLEGTRASDDRFQGAVVEQSRHLRIF